MRLITKACYVAFCALNQNFKLHKINNFLLSFSNKCLNALGILQPNFRE